MSSKKRKIGYHVLKLKMEGTEDQYRDPQVVFDILDYLCANLDEDQRTFHEKRSQKSFLLLAASTSQRGALEREVTMASGKLYHRPLLRTFEVTPLDVTPNYSKVRTRANPKELVEGEEERSHVLLRRDNNELVALFEERVVLTFSVFVKYLDCFSRLYHAQNGTERNYLLEPEIIPTGDFLHEMQKLRVQMGEVYTERALLGSPFLGNIQRIDGIKDRLVLTIKAEKGDSIARTMREIFNWMTTNASIIRKIRVRGFNNRGEEIRLDTDSIKRIEWVEVNLDPETGTIMNPGALFEALRVMMNTLLG